MSEIARTMTNGISLSQQTWAIGAPSISQHIASKSVLIRALRARSAMNWSPEATRPSNTPISGTTSRHASTARSRISSLAGNAMVPTWGTSPGA